jgi:NADH-quinone oxidoreductase subunit C
MHNELANYINSQVSDANAVANIAEVGDSSISVSSSKIFDVCKVLKDGEYEYNVLEVITGCDYLEENKIEVSYIIASFTKNTELILKTALDRGGDLKVDSVVSLWSSANFLERETFDMLGVQFEGHPDHRRILCPEDWEGFPLRKDYVPAESYRDMTINPVHKMNIGEREFGAKHAHIKGASTSVKNYAVDAQDENEELNN